MPSARPNRGYPSPASSPMEKPSVVWDIPFAWPVRVSRPGCVPSQLLVDINPIPVEPGSEGIVIFVLPVESHTEISENWTLFPAVRCLPQKCQPWFSLSVRFCLAAAWCRVAGGVCCSGLSAELCATAPRLPALRRAAPRERAAPAAQQREEVKHGVSAQYYGC